MSLITASLVLLTRVAADQSVRRQEHNVIAALQSIAREAERAAPISAVDGYIFAIGISDDLDIESSELTLAATRADILLGAYSCFSIEVIHYFLKKNEDDSYDLMLRRLPLRGPGSDGEGIVSMVVGNLTNFNVAAYANGALTREWMATEQEPLPSAIEVSATYVGGAGKNSVLVYLPGGNTVRIDRESVLAE